MGMLLKNMTGRLSTKSDKGNAYLTTTVQGPAPLQGEEWVAVLPDMRECYESAMPRIHKSLTALLKGLACSTVDVVGEGVRAIRIGNNATLLIGNALAGDTIYERNFYPQLVSAIRGLDLRVILISNPGTGKSVFQYYLLARYLNPSIFKDEGVPPPKRVKFGPREGGEAPKVVIRHMPTVGMEVWFLEKQVVHVIKAKNVDISVLNCFDPATTMYFFEPGETTGIEPYGRVSAISTLQTVSPDTSRYKEFRKIAAKAYMPVFTKNELVAIGRDMRARPDFDAELLESGFYSDEAIQGRFDTFNGIMRHVLPSSRQSLKTAFVEREEQLNTIEAAAFLRGNIESKDVSHYMAIYDVPKDQANGVYDFTSFVLAPVAADVESRLHLRVKETSLKDRINELQRYSATGINKFGAVPSIFKSVVADHLLGGVTWRKRSAKPRHDEDAAAKTAKGEKNKALAAPPAASTDPLELRLPLPTLSPLGDVPVYDKMLPNVLYRSLNKNFPFCDMVYLDDGGGTTRPSKVVCVQVSIEGRGRRVSKKVLDKFCAHLGWGASPTPEQLALIEYVYCPLPALADKAAVTFDEGVGISEYTVWHVDPNFSAAMTMKMI